MPLIKNDNGQMERKVHEYANFLGNRSVLLQWMWHESNKRHR